VSRPRAATSFFDARWICPPSSISQSSSSSQYGRSERSHAWIPVAQGDGAASTHGPGSPFDGSGHVNRLNRPIAPGRRNL
jgi:hypothetical protein